MLFPDVFSENWEFQTICLLASVMTALLCDNRRPCLDLGLPHHHYCDGALHEFPLILLRNLWGQQSSHFTAIPLKKKHCWLVLDFLFGNNKLGFLMSSLGHQSLPPTDLCRVDEEMVSPGGRPIHYSFCQKGGSRSSRFV
ncbi:hypothetical protein TNCV_4733431 [Trichonephila clavipes]|nr:hypothetical protein TNCV_4733431 [Trichonephila clavipes]